MAVAREDFETEEEYQDWLGEYGPVSVSESFTVSCNACGYSGSLQALRLHSCVIQEQGGRCEDFPCCGHIDGDGCQTLPEHTADYWMDLRRKLGDDRYDYLMEQME